MVMDNKTSLPIMLRPPITYQQQQQLEKYNNYAKQWKQQRLCAVAAATDNSGDKIGRLSVIVDSSLCATVLQLTVPLVGAIQVIRRR